MAAAIIGGRQIRLPDRWRSAAHLNEKAVTNQQTITRPAEKDEFSREIKRGLGIQDGGEGEIRTHGDLRHNSFRDCPDKPLPHLSVMEWLIANAQWLMTDRAGH